MSRAVIFDLYETLISENHPEWHSLRTEGPTPGERLGLTEVVFDREYSVRYHARMTGKLRDYSSVLREICSSSQIAPPEKEISLMQTERLFEKARPFEKIDLQVVAMLQTLKARDYRIGLISNCAHDEIAAWSTSLLSVLIDVPIFSCIEGLTKPEPEIYKLACDRLDISNDAAVFVGDGGSDELRGADAVGLKVIWATWFIETWPWDWVGNIVGTSSAFPRCRSIPHLPTLVDALFV